MGKRIIVTLDKHLKNRNKNQKEFAEDSGLREATVSHLINNKYDRIQLSNLLKVMETLEINDFNDILAIEHGKEDGK
ncbi:XRE family transcriptional regulator [Peribacillus saganii]|uniref:XRE family transcriptional regulator n=1 Tax=Peribacillus saganii TaxID=2303992 RepID=A0A372LR77_9BACI|nr:helix-turn-helix transcriptional regulator [Peribacillus saganii]RFU70320.1 XRE family transcriptional regulator [Peribacillus saganii]